MKKKYICTCNPEVKLPNLHTAECLNREMDTNLLFREIKKLKKRVEELENSLSHNSYCTARPTC